MTSPAQVPGAAPFELPAQLLHRVGLVPQRPGEVVGVWRLQLHLDA